ncbi:uncharacterized protein LOC126971784 isoform X2 [Leptidea sinapis]|uniref:uncharacterized protein LOC126971784 isoform X2 n=1 Tax=Leptidea sinapis TaxID=189913 RepID=UPI0021C37460|nr:uncharacterized protein LOC126971784 isoform X2 [Leptidea sinapis]
MFQPQTLRQFLVVTGLACCSISDGLIFGQMSGMLDALHSKNSEIPLDQSDLSWIASSINITCFWGFLLVAVVTEVYGRRRAITMLNIPVLICWIMVYLAQDKATLLISRVIVGVSYGGVLILTYLSVAEYTSPNIRSFCLNVMGCVGLYVGISLGHVSSLLFSWRTVALIGAIPTLLAIVLPLFWVESPSWLASKGRFDECKIAFEALHVFNEETNKELEFLISSEQRKQVRYSKNTNLVKFIFSKISLAIRKRYFWKISLVNTVINIYRIAGGRIMFSTLALTILQDIAGKTSILSHTLLVDGFSILGAVISCFLVKKFKMRPLLFTSGIISNTILLILAICLYCRPEKDEIFTWVKVSLLALYFITVLAGPYAVLETLLMEIIPLEIKAYFIFFFGALIGIIQFLAVKMAPVMFSSIGYHGVFIINAGIVTLCLIFLWFYLPETKGKTLEAIENHFICQTNEIELNDIDQCNELMRMKRNSIEI